MRKISCHYCLLPDGSVGKRPVIAIDDNGYITEIRISGDSFREEPGLEYFGGVLLPGFVEDLRNIFFKEDNPPDMSRMLNRFYANGSLRYICDRKAVRFPAGFRGVVFYDETKGRHEAARPFPVVSAWENIKEQCLQNNTGIVQPVHEYFTSIKQHLPEKLKWGALEVGANPGLILIKGLDFKDLKIKEKITLKILIP